MIGNDVIDLALARKESNWQRKGFLDKIYTEKEQLQIYSSKNKELEVWNLWSRKEAGYKIYNRQTGIRSYIPLQLECFDLETSPEFVLGKVRCKGLIFFTKTEITAAFIHTIAVRNFEDFNKIQYLENQVGIDKKNGIPTVQDLNNSTQKPVSISHHGQFERIVTFLF